MDQQIDQQNPGSMPRLSKRVVLSVLIVLVLIIAGAALLNARYNKQKDANNPANNVSGRPVEQTPAQYVPDGQLVEDFPEALLAGSTSIQKSYKKEYNPQTKLVTTEFTLNKTEKEAYDFYYKYLTDNGYAVDNEFFGLKISEGVTNSGMYGISEQGDKINIVIINYSARPNQLQVLIAFNPKAR